MKLLRLLPIIILFVSCTLKTKEVKRVTILYTTDEHGWIEQHEKYGGGASGLMNLWETKEGYNHADSFLVISGGDMWTGPAVSTWLRGAPLTEVMNEIGYDAATIGNHEFDFTVDTLKKRVGEMNFPLLAANITKKSDGTIPSFVKPYYIKEANGVKIGIIGLATMSTPTTSFPEYVAPYDFTDYTKAIEKYAPIVKSEGADVIIIVGHICKGEMLELVPVAKKYNIPLITGGHCHEIVLEEKDGVLMIEAGANFRNYIKVVLSYDPSVGTAKAIASEVVKNNRHDSNDGVEAIVEKWVAKADESLSEVIGYTSTKIKQTSPEMHNMILDSWLAKYPDIDVAITNAGGIRQSIPAGEIKLETIVGLMPFSNTLYKLELTGEQLKKCAEHAIVAGMSTVNGFTIDGKPIENAKVYNVMTIDYLYSRDDKPFSTYDTTPTVTYDVYRQPLIEWLKSVNTTKEKPLDSYLDSTPRIDYSSTDRHN